MWFKQHKFIFHSSGGWEVQDRVTSNLTSHGGLLSWAAVLQACPYIGVENEIALQSLFYKDTRAIYEGFVLLI